MKHFLAVLLGFSVSLNVGQTAGFLERLGFGGSKTNQTSKMGLSALGEDQVIAGLKEALSKGTRQAVTGLGKENGFLTNINVKIPMPESLKTAEKALRALKQDAYADEFVRTMNRAAESAVPLAAEVLGDSIKQMTLADAKGILSGTTNAATTYFRRTSETNLFNKFLPIVKTATEQAGVTATYKKMMDQAGGAGGGLLSGFVKTRMPDLDAYVTTKSLDGLFFMVAEEEARIRQNPAARTTEILKKVFGSADARK